LFEDIALRSAKNGIKKKETCFS